MQDRTNSTYDMNFIQDTKKGMYNKNVPGKNSQKNLK